MIALQSRESVKRCIWTHIDHCVASSTSELRRPVTRSTRQHAFDRVSYEFTKKGLDYVRGPENMPCTDQPITPGTVNGCAVGDGFRQSGQCFTPVVSSGFTLLQHDSHILSWHSSSRIRTILPFLPLVITPRQHGQSQPSRALSLPTARARLLRKAGTKLAHQSSPNSASQARIDMASCSVSGKAACLDTSSLICWNPSLSPP
mmetsp:Transcript_10190/g.25011  ORF Transcript_10190/g.25011 Transcript_10190/m.25011 type:complete len:203 (-) Transcript_10190:623-1231(-)